MLSVDTAIALAAALGRGSSIHDAAQTTGVGISSTYRRIARGRLGDPRFTALAAVAERRQDSPLLGLSLASLRGLF